MILVAGATGLVGREICRLLLEKKKPVRAIVRTSSNQELVSDLKSRGAEVVIADFKDPVSLTAACRNVQSVVSTVSSTVSRQAGDSIETVDRRGQIALIDAAKAAGVRRFVLVSFNHQKAPAKCALTEAKDAAEQHLMKSGMEYTILRPSVFMEVWLSPPPVPGIPARRGHLFLPPRKKSHPVFFSLSLLLSQPRSLKTHRRERGSRGGAAPGGLPPRGSSPSSGNNWSQIQRAARSGRSAPGPTCRGDRPDAALLRVADALLREGRPGRHVAHRQAVSDSMEVST